jgi:hypothetical protein
MDIDVVTVFTRQESQVEKTADVVTLFTRQESQVEKTAEIQRLIEDQFSTSSAARVADEAIASHKLLTVTEPEKLEFRALVDEAFKFVREQSAELAHDVVKDLAVDAVKACIVVPIGALVLQALRSKPRNPIASWFAAILEVLLETKQENPTMTADELAKRVTEHVTELLETKQENSTSELAKRMIVIELQGGLKVAFQLVDSPKKPVTRA